MSDLCPCGSRRALMLHVSLAKDELPCGRCGTGLPVEALKVPREIGHLLRRWVDQAFAIESLWFASADYEDWAKGELDSGKSRINRLGVDLAKKLTPVLETWLYSAPHAGARQAVDKYLHHCPSCHAPTEDTGLLPKYGLGCKTCRVAGSAE